MHNGELANKHQVSPSTRKECPTKFGVMYLQNKCFALGWKYCCIVGLVKTQVNQMTYETMYSAQAQSVRVKDEISFGFVGRHCCGITRS